MSTKPCPRCGSAVPSQARFCGQCGQTFGASVAGEPGARAIPTTVDEATADPPGVTSPAQRPRIGMATVLGHAILPTPAPEMTKTLFDPAPYGQEHAAEASGAGATNAASIEAKPIVSASEPPPPATSTPRAAGSDKRTMLGMPAVDVPLPPKPAPAPAPLAPDLKTMMGVAMPGIAPTHEPRPEPLGNNAGTLLGVAVPGIAPVSAGVARHVAPAPPPSPPIVPAPPPLVVEPLPEAPRSKAKKGVPAIAVIGIVFILVALIGAGAALVILRAGAPLTALPQLDETGKESLKIRCESCPDGTVITLGASSATVQGSNAVLPLPAPLAVGENDLEVKIDRPPPGRDESVKIHVPLAYRVKADLSTLTANPPSVSVRVEAAPGSEVTVEGKPVVLDASGRGVHSIDVTSEVEGPSDEQKAIDKKIAFSIKPKGANAAETGQLVVRTTVVPLHIDAPGLELHTERATGNVAGQTKPGASVTIDAQSVALDPQGRFGVRVELPAEGTKTLTIIANAPPLAPRTVRAKVVRTASLEASVQAFEAKKPLGYDAYGSDASGKVGQLVVVEGEIVELRIAQGHTAMLVEEKKTCSAGAGACIVRVVHGEEVKAARGDSVRVFGRIEGTVSSGGKSIPDVEGALVLARPGKGAAAHGSRP